jgi:hypothetical protein
VNRDGSSRKLFHLGQNQAVEICKKAAKTKKEGQKLDF